MERIATKFEVRPDQLMGMRRIIARYRAERGEAVSEHDLVDRALEMLCGGKIIPIPRIREVFPLLDIPADPTGMEIESAFLRYALDALLESYATLPVRLWEPFAAVAHDEAGPPSDDARGRGR